MFTNRDQGNDDDLSQHLFDSIQRSQMRQDLSNDDISPAPHHQSRIDKPRLSQEVAALIQEADDDELEGAAAGDVMMIDSDDEVEKHLSSVDSPQDRKIFFENSEKRAGETNPKTDLKEEETHVTPLGDLALDHQQHEQRDNKFIFNDSPPQAKFAKKKFEDATTFTMQ